ncbi:hypothetical protein [Rhizobium sp. BG6]|nr:hypothetical protein [Rhizobium sp. BG6]
MIDEWRKTARFSPQAPMISWLTEFFEFAFAKFSPQSTIKIV